MPLPMYAGAMYVQIGRAFGFSRRLFYMLYSRGSALFFVYNGFGKINDGEYIGLLFAATAKVIGRRQNVVYI